MRDRVTIGWHGAGAGAASRGCDAVPGLWIAEQLEDLRGRGGLGSIGRWSWVTCRDTIGVSGRVGGAGDADRGYGSRV